MSEGDAFKTEEEYQKAELNSFIEELSNYNTWAIEHVLMGIEIFDQEYRTILHQLLRDAGLEDGNVHEGLVTGAIHVIEHCLNNMTGLSGLTVLGDSISTILTN